MIRFAIVGVVFLASAVAYAADPDAKAAAGRAMLAKNGLTEFDANGDGRLDAGERAAAMAAKRAARRAFANPTAATGSLASENSTAGNPQWSNPGGYPYANPGYYPYGMPGAYGMGGFGGVGRGRYVFYINGRTGATRFLGGASTWTPYQW